jgi:putative acyl-CoA dehydrogenase
MTSLLRTHEVLNQPPPLGDVAHYEADPVLQEAARREGGAAVAAAEAELRAFGERAGTEAMRHQGALANAFPPQLRSFDRFGHRIDEIECHPAYHRLMTLGIEAGAHSGSWESERPGAQVARAAVFYVLAQVEAGVCCPITMTHAAVPALRAEPALAAVWVPRLVRRAYDERFVPAEHKRAVTFGMAMTEKQGGSDVRANTTRAVASGDGGYLLTGHKWFCSAPMSDAFLTLAQLGGELTCFLVPRFRPDGARNAFAIQRLKDKLGNRSNAS